MGAADDFEGESLAKLTRVFSQLIIETNEDHSVLRFRNFLKGKTAGGQPAFVDEAPATAGPRLVHEDVAAPMQ